MDALRQERTKAGGIAASNPPDATRQLAHYVVTSRWDDIPEGAHYEAVRSVFNWVGCCLGGAHHITTDRALAALAEFSGPPEATVLGRAERLDILHAALLNGITSHVLDYDDTHLETIIHPAGPVASAILALGERQNTSGTDFMHAFEEAFVSITLKDGTVLNKHVEHAIGSLGRPMSKETLEKKFSDQAASALPAEQIDRVMAMCWDVESLHDVSDIARASVPA